MNDGWRSVERGENLLERTGSRALAVRALRLGGEPRAAGGWWETNVSGPLRVHNQPYPANACGVRSYLDSECRRRREKRLKKYADRTHSRTAAPAPDVSRGDRRERRTSYSIRLYSENSENSGNSGSCFSADGRSVYCELLRISPCPAAHARKVLKLKPLSSPRPLRSPREAYSGPPLTWLR